jgi:lipopolysaccharide export system permease protein
VFGMNLLIIGTSRIATGELPAWMGLWWLHIPGLVLGAWLFWRDGRPPRPKQAAA